MAAWRRPARGRGGSGSCSALPMEGRKVARLDGRGGRAHMTGLTGGRAHIAAGTQDMIPPQYGADTPLA